MDILQLALAPNRSVSEPMKMMDTVKPKKHRRMQASTQFVYLTKNVKMMTSQILSLGRKDQHCTVSIFTQMKQVHFPTASADFFQFMAIPRIYIYSIAQVKSARHSSVKILRSQLSKYRKPVGYLPARSPPSQ